MTDGWGGGPAEDVLPQATAGEFYETLVEHASEGILTIDAESRVVFANPAIEDILGYDPDDLLGASLLELVPERLQEAHLEGIQRYLATGEKRLDWNGVELQARHADGHEVPVLVSFREHEFDGERLFTGIVRDRSQQVAHEEELQRQRRLTDQLIEAQPDVFYFFDPDGRFLRWNTRFAEVTGYDDEEIAEMEPLDFVPAADEELISESISRVLETGESAFPESALVTKDGEHIPYEFSGTRVTDERGEVLGLAGIGRDVSERKAREAELEMTNVRLEALFENSPDMLIVHDVDGTLRRVNQRICEALGYEADELVGEKVWTVDADVDPAEAREYWRTLEPRDPRRFEGRFRCRDGSTFPVEIHLVRFEVHDEDRFLVFARDVTDQKAYERRLEAQNERLDRFAKIVSHDLRNPLSVAKGNLELARETGDESDLEAVAAAHERMEELVDDLMELARTGADSVSLEPVSLATVVDECWATVDTGQATLVVETDRSVCADRGLLRQILENLFRNAVEHGSRSPASTTRQDAVEHGSTSPRSHAHEDAVEHGSTSARSHAREAGVDHGAGVTVRVTDIDDGFVVEDDGPGIPPDRRERVFESGFSTTGEGTGLGLGIVRNVADVHGWSVTVTEGRDGGARFEITDVEWA